jgi:hypothetical protein
LIAEISPLRAALEDVFVEVVGEEDRAADPEGHASGLRPEAEPGSGT